VGVRGPGEPEQGRQEQGACVSRHGASLDGAS
jgi:hypothetical protein